MFGLDETLASFSDGTSLLLVCAVAILLGVRHATDPDHLAAVSALVASGDRSGRDAAQLGLAWGAGHAATLFALGVPIVLYRAFLPGGVQQGAEALIGLMIVGLAVWLLARWRRGAFDAHDRRGRTRSPLGAFGVGLAHGVGGSAGVGILLIGAVDSHAYAVAALALLAAFTAVSMTMLSTGFGLGLARTATGARGGRLAPALGAASLAFGMWYTLAALSVAPYYF